MKTRVPEALFRFTDNQLELSFLANNFSEWKSHLEANYPQFYQAVFSEQQLNPFVKLLKDGEIQTVANLNEMQFSKLDTLEIITAMSGG